MLLQADDPAEFSRTHINSLTEEFFMVGSTYLTMVSSDKKSSDMHEYAAYSRCLRLNATGH